MRKTYIFGKIAYNKRKENLVTIEVEYNGIQSNPYFSVCGSIWNRIESDILCGGQNLDTLYPFFKDNELFLEIYDLWKKYHLKNIKYIDSVGIERINKILDNTIM